MIKKGVLAKKWDKKKQVFYGKYSIEVALSIQKEMGSFLNAECLSCGLVEVAKVGHCLIAIHVCSNSVPALKENSTTEGGLRFCKGLANMKTNLKGPISRESYVGKVIKRVAKHCAAMAIIVGRNPENTLWGWLSFARYCTNQFPATTAVLAVHKGKIIFKRRSVHQLGGFKLDSRLKFHVKEKHTSLRDAEAQDIDKTRSHAVQTSEDVSRDGSGGLKDGNFILDHGYKEKILQIELPESTLGWPLLKRTAPMGREALRKSEARNMSVVQWVMSLPNRSESVILQNQTGISFNIESNNSAVKELETEGTSSQVIQTSEDKSPVDGSRNLKDKNFGIVYESKERVAPNSVSFLVKKLPKSTLGWPLLQLPASQASETRDSPEARKMSVVQWAMRLPNRSIAVTPQTRTSSFSKKMKNSAKHKISYNANCLAASRKLPMELELSLKINSSGCRRFNYGELESATSQFSSENVIGEGGCSSVYKGCLPSGKLVALKVLKSYKEAWNDFFLEINIISSLKHKHITPLIGVCMEDNHLILVYDYLSKGSLEESLHGHSEKTVLPWEVRFKVAVAIAEALNYLHNECSQPVIHRDIKSSNILLSIDFQPQLSDFGLAVWGPTDSSYMIERDLMGTFGYIAPEYFMHGMVSDKIDIYSFGVVLLELLSGRRPIGSKGLKGQEILVKWAKPLLESGDLKTLLDTKLERDYDAVHVQRMVLAATLCINQSAQLRPRASQILKLLRAEKNAEEWINSFVIDLKESEKQDDYDDDDIFLEVGCRPQLGFALLDADYDTTSVSADSTSQRNAKQSRGFMLKDYLKDQQD